MKNSVQSLFKFVRNTVVRFIGLIFVLVGLLVVRAAIPPADGEMALVLLVGSVCVVLGGYALFNPSRFRTRTSGHHRDDDDSPHTHRNRRR